MDNEDRLKLQQLIDTFDENNWLLAVQLVIGMMGKRKGMKYISSMIIETKLPVSFLEYTFQENFDRLMAIDGKKTIFIFQHCTYKSIFDLINK